ncbi:class I SAM-dependent DNA methyltransferase [Streptomyces scabiei]|uniref:class I SAM-dependent DNA methyltransferase n=5 Tax=Streptomyces scabiei TaxID=1930 RepID=UPI001B30B60E|nr:MULTISPECIES: class I SAM-dependent DNA methyltransferase [Streptomyces]MBP5864080.1 class I SAM-dependent DNA methyltransferase [Streptomyces sp. LBUM 1484]MBP5875296.1 class I SAM-dependent DNA methyltransferase [Streptomyces sp. LBUM 1477]MBP5899137.1 class I SAM-dependent DNA methyltransferase [Streptomyces sp. LBUM 1488]MDW8472599.1 class I SAM-dependent DNA methyltransferase [Streptomyces scabiei]MDX3165314.1 class I SAM-dependent DNA methyltransferase [Streptomyces scabiei]
MTYDSLVNRGDYFSAHYLAEVLPKDLKSGLLQAWKEREEAAKPPAGSEPGTEAEELAAATPGGGELPVTPRTGLRELRRDYFRARSSFAVPEDEDGILTVRDTDDDTLTYLAPRWRERVQGLNAEVLRALGYDAKPRTLTVERAGQLYEIQVAHAEKGLVAVDCGWAAEPDAALDPKGRGRLLEAVPLDGPTPVETGSKLASFLFACEEVDGDRPPRYVLLLGGGVIVLADRAVWGEGRYLGVSLDTALQRNDTRAGGELDTVAALFGADSLRTPEEGGENPLAELVGKSAKHAVGVSSDLRDGLRKSVELIANEVLERLRGQGLHPEDIGELPELGRRLTRESLRYLYRILFLLYAEARPELGILPADYPEYQQGYGLGRLAELIADREPISDTARNGFYLYESLDLLFGKVQDGYRPRRTHGVEATVDGLDAKNSEDIGLRFEPLKSKLFERDAIRLIGDDSLPDPRHDSDEALARGESVRHLDTRLRNATLHQVLHSLMITQGKRGERGGFISYAQLGINQLGAVYEGLMSYSGFIAGEELYEVAKGGDPKDGSWLVPKSKIDEYPESVFVRRRDRHTGEDVRVRYAPGSFVYRLSGRDRQTSASYYTPESLTKVTVQLALQQLLTEGTEAKDLLNWRICEPALGSGAFLNEAINQVAAEYLRRRQHELGRSIDTEQYAVELQKAKAYIALHNSYGVDLNETAVELAEVSLWLNTMHPGMEAPWFGLHLRRGNSLIGGRREVYAPDRLKKGGWLGTTPERFALADAVGGATLPEGSVHHFLLPAKEWGAVAAEKEARALAPEAAKALGAWRKAVTKSPTARQTARLQGLARRAEYLWGLVVRRLELSERDISRHIRVWGAEDDWLRRPEVVVERDAVLADLQAEDTPYWRLKTLMDTWCALWFWPVQSASLLDGTDGRYARAEALAERAAEFEGAGISAAAGEEDSGVLMAWEADALPGFAAEPQQMTLTRDSVSRRRKGRREERLKGQRREVIPLAELDDWLDFAEALLGTQDVPGESLVSTFETLDDLSVYEDELPEWMGMERFQWLENRFLWAGMAKDVAKTQGFFHWELEFAQVFARGGFDLQVGNPPWVRPYWHEDQVLAELEPWFVLTEKPSAAERRLRKGEVLTAFGGEYFLGELATNSAIAAALSSPATYPLLVGTKSDLYRAFMGQVWRHISQHGSAGLIHPDTHFGGVREGAIRAAAYRHLRVHAQFVNSSRWAFDDLNWSQEFGMHIYGTPQEPDFLHLSELRGADVLPDSLTHDGRGPTPGIKHNGSWDIRPHRERVMRVNMALLTNWQALTGSTGSAAETPLLYPVLGSEQGAIDALAAYPTSLVDFQPLITTGYDEGAAKRDGLIRWGNQAAAEASDVILQGPHFASALPFSKQPRIPCRSNRDWDLLTPAQLRETYVPVTNYVRATDEATYLAAQSVWHEMPFTAFFRLAWRRMIPFDSSRCLHAALIPPGPAHVHTVQSMALPDNRLTALNAGFWAALPLDYLLRITGRSDLQTSEARKMPAPDPKHPLAPALLLRTLRLNALTTHYTPLWTELFDPRWAGYEDWANPNWPYLKPLAAGLKPTWEYGTPLRTEHERRAALVELDALVAVWLGITADQLAAIFKSRYPQLYAYESATYFDANGRKIAGDFNTYGHGQTKQDYLDLLAHLEDPERTPPPEGYQAPFYKADREAEMRAAHAHFQARLDAEIAAGRWTPPVREAVQA